jgi:hypothetical protein
MIMIFMISADLINLNDHRNQRLPAGKGRFPYSLCIQDLIP